MLCNGIFYFRKLFCTFGKQLTPKNWFMSKKTISIIVALAGICLIVAIISYTILNNRQEKISISTLLKAIPSEAALIFESNNFPTLVNQLHQNNQLWDELSTTTWFKRSNKQIEFLDSIFRKNENIKAIVKNSPVMISVHELAKGNTETLYLMNVPESKEKDVITFIQELTRNHASLTHRTYNNIQIFDAVFTNTGKQKTYTQTLSFAVAQQILVISFSTVMIDNALRQMNEPTSLATTPEFMKVFKTAGKNVDANIFINYKLFPELMGDYLSEGYKTYIKTLNGFAGWTGLDITVKPKQILMNGFTHASDSTNHFMKVFEGQSSHKFDFVEIIPDNTSFFMAYGIDNSADFLKRYKKYLNLNDGIQYYNRDMKAIEQEYKVDAEKMFYSFLSDELAVVFTENGSTSNNHNKFAIIKTKSKSMAETELTKILQVKADKDSKTLNDMFSVFKIDAQTSYKIYKMPIDRIAKKLFGDIFSPVETSYFVFVDNYLVLSGDENALQELLKSYTTKKILASDKHYKEFCESITARSNIFIYSNVARSPFLLANYVSNETRNDIQKNLQVIRKFQASALQYTIDGDLIYTDAYLLLNPVYKMQISSLWTSKLDTSMHMKPQIMINHNTKEKEIFIQDCYNKIYLVNNQGRVLWTKQLTEPIISEIYQIDYLKNNKLQFLFSTKSNIHLIDRNGATVAPYPIKISGVASNGISVFDYDKKMDYRILVATQDKKVLCFTKEGKAVDGWKCDKTENVVFSKIQYVTVAGKDYIFFSDQFKTYIVDRQGRPRVSLTKTFERSVNNNFYLDATKSKARLVTTSTDGTIYYVYLDGKVESETIKNYSSSHYFVCNDIDGDGNNEYIFVDGIKLDVYKQNKTLVFSKEFDEKISAEPIVFTFSQTNRKIGVSIDKTKKIYLFNSDGSIYNGFPMNGSSNFSISPLTSTKLNVIVANDENLVTYELN